jgi:Holliday junction resolvasome RuvABC endonuclease subunit
LKNLKKKATKKKPGKQMRKVEYQTQRAVRSLLAGSVLVIDPSSGSSSSMPGYAIFQAGQLIDSGIIQIDSSKEVPRRLQALATALQTDFPPVDVLIIEDIPVRSYGRNAHAHATLLKSVGAVLSSVRYEKFVEISPSVWKAYVASDASDAEGYSKGDEWDAKVMGFCVMALARKIEKGRTK